MKETVMDLALRVRSLPPTERERRIELLQETLVEPAALEIEEAWNREIVRRVAAYRLGGVETVGLGAVLAEAKAIAP